MAKKTGEKAGKKTNPISWKKTRKKGYKKVSSKKPLLLNNPKTSPISDPPLGKPKYPPDLSPDEQRIYEVGQQAYQEALGHLFHPSLPEPVYMFDYTNSHGFYIEPETWQITLNLANTPDIHLDNEFSDYFFSLSLHELSHYTYCPFDNLTNMELIAASIKAKAGKIYAPIIVNLFTDLIIDYRNFQDFEEIMAWEFEQTVKQIVDGNEETATPSKMWLLLVECYQQLWKISLPNLPKSDDNVIKLAKRIKKILLTRFEDKSLWQKKVGQITKSILSYLQNNLKSSSQTEDHSGNGGSSKKRSNLTSAAEITESLIPEDVKTTFGNLGEIRQIARTKNQSPGDQRLNDEIQEDLEQLATEYNYQTYSDTLSLLGVRDTMKKLSYWYRGQVRNIFDIRIYEPKASGAIPISPEKWRIGDPIEELDPVQSLLVSPVIIPNITTRKWIHMEGFSSKTSNAAPDMMIVLDSSGSMDWNFNKTKITGNYHTALIASFGALDYAIKHGCQISAINFSERVYYCDWTNKSELVEATLLNYQGEGTYLPDEMMLDLAKKAKHKTLILVISDLELYNWEPTKAAYLELLQRGHHVISFFIDGDKSMLLTPDFTELIGLGASFYCIKKPEELIGLVISEVSKVYGETSDKVN